MKLYALLVGINSYPIKPLSQCVNDVNKLEEYLQSIKSNYSEIHIKKLINEEANKDAIVTSIKEFLTQAEDDDVALMYYSGHGAQEKTAGIFSDEHDGLLECLVAHYDSEQTTGFLLADKEIRYLFSKFEHNPHFVTIFDCCHSGDIVRAMGDDEEESMIKRLVQNFPSRHYNEFIFSDEVSAEMLQNNNLSRFIPSKNHIHIAACLSSELSWENENGGVFTTYLIQLLNACNSKLNYLDITKWAKIGLKEVTKKKQTPTYSIQGEGKLSPYSSWLNMYPEEGKKEAKLIYNKINGWHFTRGKLMGVKEGTGITIFLDNNEKFETVVESVDLEFSIIKDPLLSGIELDTNKDYVGITDTTYSKLSVYVNDLEREDVLKCEIEDFIREQPEIELSEAGAANYFINIFNQMVYISLPGDEFRPLAEQIDLLDDNIDLKAVLKYQLSYVIKWNHFDTLANPDNKFDRPPIKVEICVIDTDKWHDITDTEFYLESDKRLENGLLYQEYKIKVTNVSNELLHIGVLILNSDFEISTKPFQNIIIQLEPGSEKLFFDHNEKSFATAGLDNYKEIYNWKSEWFHYKFIINNYEDLTTSLSDFKQPALDHPILKDYFLNEQLRFTGASEEFQEIREKWGTLKSTIHLNNSTYNLISGDLEKYWDDYIEDERIAPFISNLYFEKHHNGLVLETSGKPNRIGEDQAERGFWNIKLNIGNFLDDKRRKRIFLKARRRLPDKPVILAEGDSWFLYPFLVKDTIDYLMEKFPVRSIAAAGDELSGYIKTGQLLREAADIRPEYVLISGGGNDIIGPEIVDILKKDVGEGKNPEEYLNSNYHTKRQTLKDQYEYFFTQLKNHSSIKHIFVHGYDFVRTDHEEKIIKKGWVNKYMIQYGIKNLVDRERLLKYLVNNFNEDLFELTKMHENVTYVDMRNLVKKGEWYDEIHPNDIGFEKVGNKFIMAIEAAKNKQTS